MKLKRSLTAILIVIIPALCLAQTKTTEALHKRYNDATTLFFYNSTLRMLNQNDDKAFDELIKDIEKMKFLMINKSKNFDVNEYKKIVSGYKDETFEEIMTSRHQGKTFDIYLKEKNNETKGVVVLINSPENLYVLDIVGKIAVDKITSLYSQMEGNSEIAQRIKSFGMDDDDDKKDGDRDNGKGDQ